MPWTKKQQRAAQAILSGVSVKRGAKGFTTDLARQIVAESKAMPTRKAVKREK